MLRRIANWVRELVGWGPILLGLVLVLFCLGFLQDRQVVEGGIVAILALVIFRGGIHLVKVSVAARIVLAAGADKKRAA